MRRSTIAALLAGLLLTGCAAVGPTYQTPTAPIAPAFRNLASVPTSSTRAASDKAWWTGFADPMLNQAVDDALAQNMEIEAAAARVAQASASARAAGAALLPAAQLQLDADRAHQSLVGSNAQQAAYQRDVNLFDAGVGASWEVDLFGGLRRSAQAARADAAAADSALTGTRLAIAAETADAYLQLRGFQSRLALARRRVADDEKVVELTTLLSDAGHAPRLQT